MTASTTGNGIAVNPNDADLLDFRDSVAGFLAKECGPQAVHEFIDRGTALADDIWRTAANLGWLAVGIPEDCGGLGLGPHALAVIHTEVGRRTAPGPYVATLAGAQWISATAEEREKQAYLSRICSGELTLVVPADLSGAPMLSVDHGCVTGSTQAMLGSVTAGLAIIPVAADGIPAWTLVDVDGRSARLSELAIWDRTRQLCRLECDGATVVALIDNRDGTAEREMARHLALALACDSLGGARAILELTVEYAKTRMQFGHPIGSFQAIKHRISDMFIKLSWNEQLVGQAIDAAARNVDADLWALLAKAEATTAFSYVAAECVQLHGGIGFTWEYDCHLFLKRARLNEGLVRPNSDLRDLAADGFAAALLSGRSPLEMAES